MTVWDLLRQDYEDDDVVLRLIDLCEAADRAHARGPRDSHERLLQLLAAYRA